MESQKKHQAKISDLLGQALDASRPTTDPPTAWSTDETNGVKRLFDRMMRLGNNTGSPDSPGFFSPVCPAWQWKPEFRAQYNAVLCWIIGVECECHCRPVSPQRGLWLAGNPGTGKSTLLRAVKNFCACYSDPRSPNLPRAMLWCHAKDIACEYEREGGEALDRLARVPALVIDDVGTEGSGAMHFGNVKNVVEDVLSRRYDRRLLTMATTNRSMEQIRADYGDRIYDRVREMFSVIEFAGPSHRRLFASTLTD